jgi:hypothetical protein
MRVMTLAMGVHCGEESPLQVGAAGGHDSVTGGAAGKPNGEGLPRDAASGASRNAGGLGGANGDSGADASGADGIGSIQKTLDSWPQAGGLDGTFRVDVDGAPTTWSVAAHKNILWQTDLDNEGQGGIAVTGDLLFLTTFLPFTGSKTSLTIEGYAINRENGQIKWRTKPLTGNALPSGMAYQYSDATSWTPITDGKYVWFFNAAGHVGCWDVNGVPDASGQLAPIWETDFFGQNPIHPFNRQHEPFIVGNDLVILSRLGMGQGDPTPAPGHENWNYLHGIDKMTGRTTWAAQDASTFYNTAVMGKLPDGTPAVVHARGGPHESNEAPIGLSLTSLAPGSEGKSLWQYKPDKVICTGGSATTPQTCTGDSLGSPFFGLYNTSWDGSYAYWFAQPPDEILTIVDIRKGTAVGGWSLSKRADIRRWDTAKGAYVSLSGVNVNTTADWTYQGMMHVAPLWHTNIVAKGYVWFLTATNCTRWAAGHTGPPHSVGRVNISTGKVEYLELPVGVQRMAGAPDQLVYGRDIMTTAQDAKGNDVADDASRSHTDGWSIPAFYSSPVLLGNKLYFGTTVGITYVIDAGAAVLDEKAILGYGDLGPLGQTWSLATPAFAGGVLYHHSSKQVVAISAP